jgi:RHS repeat-associated protein
MGLVMLGAVLTITASFGLQPRSSASAHWTGRAAGSRPASSDRHGSVSASGADRSGRLVSALSGRFSRTVRRADGTMLTRVSRWPLNFRDAAGRWRAIDNTLVARGHGWVNRADRYRAELPRSLRAPVVVRKGRARLSMRLLGGAGSGRVSGRSATYSTSLPGTSVRYVAGPNGLEESIVLTGSRVPEHFTFDLGLSAGLALHRTRGGAIEARDRHGRSALRLAASVMFPGSRRHDARPVASKLVRTSKGWRLTLTPDPQRLRRLLAHGSVTIDPTVEIQGAAADCTIQSDLPNTNFCSLSTVEVGYTTVSPAHDHRILLKFDLSSIPRDAIVLNGDLGMSSWTHSTNTPAPIGAYRLLRDWTNGATWNTYDGTHAWATPGATGAADSASTPAATQTIGAGTGAVEWYPTKLVQDWVSGDVPNQGMLLRDVTPNTPDNDIELAATEAGGIDPELDITWVPRTGKVGSYTYDSQTLSDRMSLDVNVANGNLLVTNHDLDIAGTAGSDAVVDRVYNSLIARESIGSSFGERTSSGLSRDVKLQAQPNGDVAFFRGDGAAFLFSFAADNGTTTTYSQPADLNAKLTKNDSTGVYTMTYVRTGSVWTFNSARRLTTLKDKDNNTISLSYTGDGKSVSSITDTQGRAVTVTRTDSVDNYVKKLTDSTGRIWSYTYDVATTDNVADYTDPAGKHTIYGRDGNDRVTSITTPAGNVAKIAYDSDGRVTSIIRTTNAGHTTGPTTTYAYSTGTGAANACASGVAQTVVTDPNGNATTYCSSTKGRVTETYDALPAHYRHTGSYNDNGDRTATSDLAGTANPMSNSFTYATDGTNDLTGGTGPSGETFSMGYYTSGDPTGDSGGGSLVTYRPKSFTNAQGSVQNFKYNSNGDVTSIADAVGRNQAAITRNSDGTVASVTDGNSNTTTFGYDANHNLNAITPPAPGTTLGTALAATSITNDALSRAHVVTNGKGTFTYTFDNLDRVTRVDASDGSWFKLTYDNDGNITKREDNSGNVTNYTNDPLNRRLTEGFPGSVTTTYTYDDNGNLKTIADASGTVTYGYDEINRVTSIVSPTASGSSTDTVSYGYVQDGSAVTHTETITFPGGATENFTLNQSGRLTKVETKSNGGTVLSRRTYTYDLSPLHTGKVQTMTDLAGNTTTYTYTDTTTGDDVGRLWKAVTRNSGGTITTQYDYTYDPAGNRTTRVKTDSGGTTTTTYKYNNDNQLCWAYTGTSANTCGSPPSGATTFTYDANGNQLTGGAGGTKVYNIFDRLSSLGGTSLATLSVDNTELVGIGASTTLQNNQLGLSRQTLSGTTTAYVRQPDGTASSQRTTAGKQFFLADNIGSTTGLLETASGGSIVKNYSYTPDGVATASGSGTATDLQFAGGYTLASGLVHFGARYYDPNLARWGQEDPVSQFEDLAQGNRYVYVGGDPINRVDLTGRLSLDDVGDFVGDNLDSAASALSSSLARKLYCTAAIGSLGAAGAATGGPAGAGLGAAGGGLLCGALETSLYLRDHGGGR